MAKIELYCHILVTLKLNFRSLYFYHSKLCFLKKIDTFVNIDFPIEKDKQNHK